MLDIVKNGTLIVAEGIALPASCDLTSEPFSEGWRTVKNFQAYGLDKRLNSIGWTFLDRKSVV